MKRLILCTLLPLTLLTGCSSPVESYLPSFLTPYRPDIHQGNVVTSEMVENLHEGMTKNQVIFLLGTSTLKSIFHNEEWNYVYYLNPRSGKPDVRKLSILFNDDGRVESFRTDPMPDETGADLQILGERARENTLKQNQAVKEQKAQQEAVKSETSENRQVDKTE